MIKEKYLKNEYIWRYIQLYNKAISNRLLTIEPLYLTKASVREVN